MSETTNPQVLTEDQIRIESLMRLAKLDSECLKLLTETLFILSGKRETLEENMIKSIFHKLTMALARTMEVLNESCLEKKFPQHEKVLEASDLFEEIRLSVSELLKIVQYDLNFLEQYFEYDYCAKLHSELHFVERVDSVLAGLKGLT